MNFAAWFSSLVQPRRLPLRKAPRASLQLERLEDRAVPATHTWTGAGGDGNWSNSANWSGGAPTLTEGTNHDDPVKLVFGASSRKTSVQNIPNLIVDAIRFDAPGYTIKVNSTLVLREFDNQQPTGQQIFCTTTGGATNAITGPGAIRAASGLSPELLVDGPATALTISAVLAGSNGYGKSGSGKLTLSGANTFAGTFGVNSGTLVAKSAAALGSSAYGTGVDEGATLDVQADIGFERLTFSTNNDPPMTNRGGVAISAAARLHVV